MGWTSVLEVSSQCRQAVCKTSHTACLQLLGNFKHTFPTPFGALSKKKLRLLTEANSKGFYYNELYS